MKLLSYVICLGYLVKHLADSPSTQPEPKSKPQPQSSPAQPTHPPSTQPESTQTSSTSTIVDEIDALDSLVAALARKEQELREQGADETKIAKVHLQLIKYNNKAVKLWEELE